MKSTLFKIQVIVITIFLISFINFVLITHVVSSIAKEKAVQDDSVFNDCMIQVA